MVPPWEGPRTPYLIAWPIQIVAYSTSWEGAATPVLGTLRTTISSNAKAAILRWGLLRLFTVNVFVKKLLRILALIF